MYHRPLPWFKEVTLLSFTGKSLTHCCSWQSTTQIFYLRPTLDSVNNGCWFCACCSRSRAFNKLISSGRHHSYPDFIEGYMRSSGFSVRLGCRQSIPSRNIDSWTGGRCIRSDESPTFKAPVKQTQAVTIGLQYIEQHSNFSTEAGF